MPIKLGIEELRNQILDQEAIIKMVNEIKNVEVRTVLINLYNVIIALWTYWNITQEEETEYHISYYQRKFFDLFFKQKEKEKG